MRYKINKRCGGEQIFRRNLKKHNYAFGSLICDIPIREEKKWRSTHNGVSDKIVNHDNKWDSDGY